MRDDNKDDYIAWLEGETRDMRETIQTLHEALSVFVNMGTDYGRNYHISDETMERASDALLSVPEKWLPADISSNNIIGGIYETQEKT